MYLWPQHLLYTYTSTPWTPKLVTPFIHLTSPLFLFTHISCHQNLFSHFKGLSAMNPIPPRHILSPLPPVPGMHKDLQSLIFHCFSLPHTSAVHVPPCALASTPLTPQYVVLPHQLLFNFLLIYAPSYPPSPIHVCLLYFLMRVTWWQFSRTSLTLPKLPLNASSWQWPWAVVPGAGLVQERKHENWHLLLVTCFHWCYFLGIVQCHA